MRNLRAGALAMLLGCASAAPETSVMASPSPAASIDIELDDVELDDVELDYVDVTGADRTVRAELRAPAGVGDEPRPVVVWSHGGAAGFDRTDRVARRWGRALNDAGIAVVAVAHPGRSAAARSAVCDAIGGSDCAEFNALLWDRPHDVAVVLDWVERVADDRGLDARRILIGGHSAGAVGAMTVAGMEWTLDTRLAPPSDPRPIGFIAASPPGAAVRSLDAGSLAAVDRPVLFLTGAGDTTSGTEASDRRSTFSLLPDTTDSAMLWIDRSEARHGLFNLSTSACQRAGGSASGCRAAARSVADVGVAFAQAVAAAVVRPDADGFDATRFVGRFDGRLPAAAELSTAS